MLLVMVLVMLGFEVLLGSRGISIFSPQNLSNLIAQNSYVIILATGMLLCILTGGNIDLSVGQHTNNRRIYPVAGRSVGGGFLRKIRTCTPIPTL